MTVISAPRRRWQPSRVLGWYARWMVQLRWLVVAFWAAAVGATVLFLPAVGHSGSDLNELVSSDNPAVQSEVRSLDKFGFPLLSRVAVVQRNPEGLPLTTQAEAVERARAVSRGEFPDAAPIVAAVPVPNTLALFPGSQESGTTVITLLFTPADVSFADQLAAAEQFVAKHFDANDHVVGVTGSVPARVEQGRIILSSLPVLELVTVAAVLLIVAVSFRSVVAPLVTLAVAGVAILLTLHLAGAAAERFGLVVPQETQPLLVALLLGVVTDYVIFYLSAMRGRLASGAGRLAAAEWATARFTPIIATAGATAAAGTAALIVAKSPAFQAFGPGMGLAVLTGMVVAVTLVPALLAILGSVALWPGRPRKAPSSSRPVSRSRAVPQPVAAAQSGPAAEPDSHPSGSAARWAQRLTRPGYAVVVLVLCVGGLVAAALPVRDLSLGLSFIPGLPPGEPARQAAEHAETGFADGILSPTELLIQGSGVATQPAALSRLKQSLSGEPGVAGVVGPGDDILPEARKLFHAADGTAVRYLLILSDEPLGARAIATASRLEDRLPELLSGAGLTGAQASLGGDTAIAKVIVDQTVRDLGRIVVAALAANLLFLILFLRALVAPVLLLACSVLAIGATLGLTTQLFQGVLGADGLTFYVPFAAAVLLAALGSDYNIFGIGHAWEEARVRPLREALAITIPQSARAIRTAGFTLAISFGLLAIVPLRPFRELAFALTVGILIDSLIVRSLLAPAVLTLAGSASGWPGRQLFRRKVVYVLSNEEPVKLK
ncbi:MAG TPA: MMPL family transporter [Micromonosporaceae bacterium]|nr:MMPL family transporter [Micromonosporaceae bacterium]